MCGQFTMFVKKTECAIKVILKPSKIITPLCNFKRFLQIAGV